jgi:hypothetical protein
MKAYLVTLTEINGEYEYLSNFVLYSEDDPDMVKEHAREITKEWRGGAEYDDDSDFAWNDDGCTAVQYDYHREIPMEEAKILEKYLFSASS